MLPTINALSGQQATRIPSTNASLMITSSKKVIEMTQSSASHLEPRVRLYQVNKIAWGAPVMIAAERFKRAAELAAEHDRASALGGLLVVDATDEFNALSPEVQTQTDLMCASGIEGLVDYDEERGWVVIG
jgi:hypothetical protein